MVMIVQLVGPPACGKRTIGAVLAERTGAILIDTPEDAAAAQVIRDLATARGATFHPVWLRCDIEEIRRRLTLPDRAVRNKLRDPSRVDHIVAQGMAPAPTDALLLDTTRLDARESADRIVGWLGAEH